MVQEGSEPAASLAHSLPQFFAAKPRIHSPPAAFPFARKIGSAHLASFGRSGKLHLLFHAVGELLDLFSLVHDSQRKRVFRTLIHF